MELMCYVDADCNFLGSLENFSQVSELQGFDVGYFGRNTFTETGVLFFRLRPEVGEFLEKWTSLYFTDEFKSLGGWTDCHTFDFCRKNTNVSLVFKNLNSINEQNHPIAKSFLKTLVDHRKGDRKVMDISPEIKNV
jgi:hypothetical protein